MGDNGVIALLGRISMNLDKIVQASIESQNPQKQQEHITAALNSSTAATAAQPLKPAKSEPDKIVSPIAAQGLSPFEISGFLKSFPKQVLSVASLRKTAMKDFYKTFEIFADSLKEFNAVKVDPNSAKAAKDISQSLLDLTSVDFKKLSKELKTAHKNDFDKLFVGTMKQIVTGLGQFEKLDGSKMKVGLDAANSATKLLQTLVESLKTVMVGVIGMAIAIKFIGAGEILKATGVVLGTIAALAGIAVGVALLSKLVGPGSGGSLNRITKYIFHMQLLAVSTLALGVMFKNFTPTILIGFAGISAMMIGYAVVIALASVVAALSTSGIVAMKSIMIVAGVGILLTATTMMLGVFAKDSADDIKAGFIATAGIIFGYTMVISAAATIAKGAHKALIDFAAIGVVTAGAEALVLATLRVGAVIRSNGGEWMLLEGFAMAAGIIMGYTYIVRAAASAAKGLSVNTFIQLAEVEALAAATGPVILATVGVAHLIEGTKKEALVEALSVSAAIIGGMLMLVKAASRISQKQTAKAALALGSVELLATGMLGVVFLASKVAKAVDNAGNAAMLEALGYSAGIIAATGALAFAAGALVFGPQALLFAAGLAAMASIDLLIAGTAATMMKVAKAAKVTSVLTEDELKSFTGTFSLVVENLASMVGLRFVGRMAVITASTPMIKSVSHSMAEIAECMSKIALISGPNGTIRGVKVGKDGSFAYSEYVDVKASVASMSDSIKLFVSTLSGTFKAVSSSDIIKSSVGMRTLGQVVEPVSMFARAMLSFQDAGEGKIREIRYKSDGTLIDTPAVDVALVSSMISRSITMFANIMFSKKNQETWKRIVEGEHNQRTGATTMIYAEKAMGILATIISPVCEFANTLSQFEASNGNSIVIPVYDDRGNVVNTRVVDVVKVATSIAGAVSKFASTLFGSSATWSQLYKPETHKTKKGGLFTTAEYETVNTMENAVGVFSNVLTPVIGFTSMLSKYGTSANGELLLFDNAGKSRTIDILKIATKIGMSVSTFMTTLTGSITSSGTETGTALSTATKSLQGIFGEFDKFVNDNDKNSLNKFKLQVDGMGKAFKEFDKTLSDGDAKRVNSIKKLGQAFDDLRSKLVNAKSDIEQVKDIFKSLNEVDTSNIDNVIEKIASKLKVTIDNEGSMTRGDVAAAIRSALDGGTLQQYTFGSGKSERNRFEIDLDGSFQH